MAKKKFISNKSLPNFDEMIPHYPATESAEDVKAQIGGDVNQGHYHNTCIIRVSQALNYTGHPIPRGLGWFITKRGTDKKWYGLRVAEFWEYMLKTYGEPTVHKPKGKNGIIPVREFAGIRGIIGFRVRFKGATGHFTLWDGFRLLYGGEEYDYFGAAKEAALWEAGTTRILIPDY